MMGAVAPARPRNPAGIGAQFFSLKKFIRVVQKPQFLNNFPEKNREFAAICGKFSGTWERTARFLNKSITHFSQRISFKIDK
jgi:hypothetical protein